MAAIRDWKFSQSNATTLTPDAPDITNGDGLLMFVWHANQADTSWYTVSGWTQIGVTTKVITNFVCNVYYRVAVTPETMPTITFSSGVDHFAVVMSIAGCNTGNFIDSFAEASAGTLSSAAEKKALPTLTPTAANCMILYVEMYNTKGVGYRPLFDPLDVPILGYQEISISGSNEGGFVFSAWQHDPATTAVKTGNSRIPNQNYRAQFMIAIEDDGTDTYRQPSLYSESSKRISNFARENVDDWIVDIPGDYDDPITQIADINGDSTVYYAIKTKGTTFTTTAGALGYSQVKGSSFGEQLTASSLNCFRFAPTSAIDFTNAVCVLHFSADQRTRPPPLDGQGVYLVFQSGASDWKAFQMPQTDTDVGVNTLIVDPSYATAADSSGTLNPAAVTGITIIVDANSNVANEYVCFSSFTVSKAGVITGGGSAYPVTAADIGQYCAGQIVQAQGVQGSRQLHLERPITLGSQSAKSYIDLSQTAIELGATTTKKNKYTLLTAGTLGINVDTKASSTLKMNNSIVSSDTAYFFKPTASVAGTNDFTDTQFINADPYHFRSNCTYTGMTLVNCGALTTNGTDLSGYGITIDNNSSTYVFTVTSQTELNYLADIIFTNCNTCIKVNVSGAVTTLNFPGIVFGATNTWAVEYTNAHNIEFTRSGACDLTAGKITSTGGGVVTLNTDTVVDITAPNLIAGTRVQIVDMTNGGTLTSITRSGTTATATKTAHGFVTGQSIVILGAEQGEYNGLFTITVTDANTFTFTVSGTPATPATGTITARRELDNSVVVGGAGYSLAYTHTGSNITVRLRACYASAGTAYMPIVTSLLVTTAGASLLDSQELDEDHNDYGVDGSTVTEITADYDAEDNVNVFQIQVDDPDNGMDCRRGVAWFRYITTTAQGIREFDPEALQYDPDIRNITITPALRIKNADVSNALVISEGIWRNADSSLIYDTTGGSIFWSINDRVYQGPETGTSGLTGAESTQLFTLATASQVDTIDNFLDTEIAAIKAKTDNLPAAPAAAGDIPSAATIASAVLTEAQSSPIHADAKLMNASTVYGTGVEGDLWRGAA